MKKFCLIILAFLLFVSCSENKNNDKNAEINDCIITDKGVLEDLTLFTADNPLNTDIYNSPVDPHSDAIISMIGSPSVHADFGSGLYDGLPMGIPFILVCKDQTAVPIIFRVNSYDDNYGDESDPGPYPVPLSAPVEGNGTGDSHVLCVDIDNKILYEMYNAAPGTSSWEASSGVVWDLKTDPSRTAGWTSADAAGLPILPLLIRYEEVKKGTIDHAIRFTLGKNHITRGYIPPARHLISGTNTNPDTPVPMGMRVRLKRDFDISGFSATNQIILTAMKHYGLILADAGSDFFISGAPAGEWDNDDLHVLTTINASDFEVVQMGDIITK